LSTKAVVSALPDASSNLKSFTPDTDLIAKIIALTVTFDPKFSALLSVAKSEFIAASTDTFIDPEY